jgi:hypothetical protein
MYYWYYGTMAMFQVGGDAWSRWNKALREAVVPHQRGDGNFDGSWDPVGPWGADGGRVYSTAMMTLCMEVYYRYARVFGARTRDAAPPDVAAIRLDVARASASNPVSERRVVFRSRRDGRTLGSSHGLVDDKDDPRRLTWTGTPAETREQINSFLRAVRRANPEAGGEIDAAPRTPHAYVAEVLGMMATHGYTTVAYSGLPPSLLEDLERGRLK